LIIIRGRNVYPQDIERTSQQAHESVENGAAFSVGDPGHEELIVVHQVGRERRKDDMNAVMRAIRAAIVDEHEVDPQAIVLLRPTSLPMTSSGKVQRGRCRELFLTGELQELDRWTRPTESAAATTPGVESGPPRPKFLDRIPNYSVNELALEVQQWMMGWLASRVEDGLGGLTADSTFAQMGVDSLTALELNLEFEKVLGLRLPPGEAWSYPTPAALAQHLAKSLHNIATMGAGPGGNPADSWFAAMDTDVER
jgi:acyl carrier protein